MATKEVMKKRQNDILMRLEKGGSASIQELMEITGTKERTLKEDIKSLRDAGNKIELKGDRVTLLEEVMDVAEHSSSAVARQVAVILQLGENPGLTKDEIVENLIENMDFEVSDDSRQKDSVRKNLENDLDKLSESGMIRLEGKKYFMSPMTNSISKYQDRVLVTIYQKIMTSGENSPYSSVLYNIAEKIADLMRYRLYDNDPQKKVSSLQIRDNKAKIDKYRETALKLFAQPFKERKLIIKWKTKKEELREVTLAVERIVYSCESGKMHLIGVSDNSRYIWDKTPIDIADITDIGTTDSDNRIYNNSRINEILAESVVIDTKEPHEIETEFDNTKEILEKVKQLANTRRATAQTKIRDDKIIYKDTIRGVRDITKILRKFGSSCRITKDSYKHSQNPSKDLDSDLKRIMYESAKGTIERYSDGEDK